ncbi:retrotransposon protein, putative, ty3-gypsy subclass, partial [Tanacetum coccineum]
RGQLSQVRAESRERAKGENEPSQQPKMSADVAWGHGGDGGGDDRPPTHHIPTGCGGCFANRGKGTRKPNLGGRKEGMLHTRQETQNLGLKKITNDKSPVLIREMSLYYPSWQKVPAERKAVIVTNIGTQFDLTPPHWVINPETGMYEAKSIRQRRPQNITPTDWDAHIAFWNDPRNQARAAQNRQNRAKSTVVCRQGSWLLSRLRDHMMESSATREYPSLIHTFFVTYTVNGSAPEFGNANGNGRCEDDEMADDEDDGEDEEDGDSATKSLRKVAGKVSLESFPLQFIPGAGLVSQMTSRPGRRGFVAGDSVMEKNKSETPEESEKLLTVLQNLHDDLKLCNRRLDNADPAFEGINS